MEEPIRIGRLEIRFLQSRHDTSGSMDLFELMVPSQARVPLPHYHRDFDEALYGLEGGLAWTIDGRKRVLGPGEHAFIRRGQVHGFENPQDATARCLCILTPGLIGPEYFQEMAAVVNSGDPPDVARIRDVMERYGLIPVLP